MLEIQGVEKKACCGNGGSQTRGPVQSKQDFPKMLCTYEEALKAHSHLVKRKHAHMMNIHLLVKTIFESSSS